MRQPTTFSSVLWVASLVWPIAAQAQTEAPRPAPLSIGAFYSLGFEKHDASNQPGSVLIPLAGIYGEWTRYRVHPGLDLRGEAGEEGIRGTLVGPRVSTSWKILHPYVEGLFGPNHFLLSDSTSTLQEEDREGVTKEVAFGLDADVKRYARWRVVEFTYGSFSGVHGSTPHTVSTGIVLHFP
jgi:hypothetical protein